MSKMDEAVEVASREYEAKVLSGTSHDDAWGAALRAALPVLLQPVVEKWRADANDYEEMYLRTASSWQPDWESQAKAVVIEHCADRLESIYTADLEVG